MPAIGRHEFRDLLALSWPMAPDALAARLPGGLGLEPDLHEGKAWVSVVALELAHMRPGFLPVPRAVGLTSRELNVRTYVERDGEPGIWFFSMDTSSRLVALGSRAAFRLAASHADVRLERSPRAWTARRGDLRFRAEFEPGAALGPSPPGSLDHFLLERFVLHTPNGRAVRLRRPPFDPRAVRISGLEDGFGALPGLPVAAHYVERSAVEIVGA